MVFGQIIFGEVPGRIEPLGGVSYSGVYADLDIMPIFDVWRKQCCADAPSDWSKQSCNPLVVVKCS